MFLGWPKHSNSSRLLDRAMSVHDDLSLALPLPSVSLLSSGLLADGYGAVVVTLQKYAQMRISFWEQMQTCYIEPSSCDLLKQMR